jgi:hypothetical protein
VNEADELAFLRWFYRNALFGPMGDDVRARLCARWTAETGRRVPKKCRPLTYSRSAGWGESPTVAPTWSARDLRGPRDIVPGPSEDDPDRI